MAERRLNRRLRNNQASQACRHTLAELIGIADELAALAVRLHANVISVDQFNERVACLISGASPLMATRSRRFPMLKSAIEGWDDQCDSSQFEPHQQAPPSEPSFLELMMDPLLLSVLDKVSASNPSAPVPHADFPESHK